MAFQVNSLTIPTILLLAPFLLGITSIDAQVSAAANDTTDGIAQAAEAPVNCNANSPDCCWVTRIFQMMGKTIDGSAFSVHKACCRDDTQPGIPGVECDSTGKVVRINWNSQNLIGHIPSALGEIKDLTHL